MSPMACWKTLNWESTTSPQASQTGENAVCISGGRRRVTALSDRSSYLLRVYTSCRLWWE